MTAKTQTSTKTYIASSIDGRVEMTAEELSSPGTDWSDDADIPVFDADTGETVAWIDPRDGTVASS